MLSEKNVSSDSEDEDLLRESRATAGHRGRKRNASSAGQINVQIHLSAGSSVSPKALSSHDVTTSKQRRGRATCSKSGTTKPTKTDSTTHTFRAQCHGKVNVELKLPLLPEEDGDTPMVLSQSIRRSPRKFGIARGRGRGSPSKRLSKHSPLRYFRQAPLTSFFRSTSVRKSLSFSSSQDSSDPQITQGSVENSTGVDEVSSETTMISDSIECRSNDTSSTSTSLTNGDTNQMDSSNERVSLSNVTSLAKETATLEQALEAASTAPAGDLYADVLVQVLAPVLRRAHYAPLLLPDEWRSVVAYLLLPASARTTVTRLLARKPGWHRLDALSRYGTPEQLQEYLTAAQNDDFVTLDYSHEDPSVLLPLLKVGEMKTLCKELRVPAGSKTKMLSELTKLTAAQKGITGSTIPVVQCASRILGPCVRLKEDLRSLMSRLLLLASLGCAMSDEDRALPSMVLRITNVQTGRVLYPKYEIIHNTPIFSSREHFIRFKTAMDLQTKFFEATEKKDWEMARHIASIMEGRFKELLQDQNVIQETERLPAFLRQFCAGTVYARCLPKGADAYRRGGRSHFLTAVHMLETVLGQRLYRPDRRGRAFVHLALLQHKHLRDHAMAAATVLKGLSEPEPECCSTAERLSLVRRAVTLAECRSSSLPQDTRSQLRLAFLHPQPIMAAPVTTVKARKLDGRTGYKGVYVMDDQEANERQFSSVEEVVLAHYRKSGYTEGIHCEGSVVTSLFALLFWDIIYEIPVPDVFLSPYQTAPLDLGSQEFYSNRRDAVDCRLAEIQQWDEPHLQRVIGERFEQHLECLSLVSWGHFHNVSRLTGLVRCMGGKLLSLVCERFAKNFRNCRRGFPDLVLWMPSSRKCKLVEVKGPNDRLSPDQEIWLDFLCHAGADAEVCRVDATGSKKLSKKSTSVEEENADHDEYE